MRKKIIAIMTVIAFIAVIGGSCWTQYQNKKLEAEAYKYVANNLYTLQNGLEIREIKKTDDGKYNIYYQYNSTEDRLITGSQMNVTF